MTTKRCLLLALLAFGCTDASAPATREIVSPLVRDVAVARLHQAVDALNLALAAADGAGVYLNVNAWKRQDRPWVVVLERVEAQDRTP